MNKNLKVFCVLSVVFACYVHFDDIQSFFTHSKRVVTQEQAAINYGQSYPAKLLRIANIVGVAEEKTKEVERLALEIRDIKDKKLIERNVKEKEKALSLLMVAIKEKDMPNVLQRYEEFLKGDPKKQEKLEVARLYLEKELLLLPQIADATEVLRLAKIEDDKAKISSSKVLLAKLTDQLYVEGTEDFDTSLLSRFATQP